MVSAIKTDHGQVLISDVDRVILDFAVKLTRSPAEIKEADIVGLRSVGLDDAVVLDVIQVTALFNYYNRLADGVGIDLEPEMPPKG